MKLAQENMIMEPGKAKRAAYHLAIDLLQKQGSKELARALKAGTSQEDVALIAYALKDIIAGLQLQVKELKRRESS
jgi:hypothetical protein